MPEPDDPVVPQPDPKGPEIPEEEPGTDEPTPLRETGRRLGISPERVRQLESRALKHLATTRELEGLHEAA